MRNWKVFAFAAVASTLLAGSLQAQAVGKVRWAGVSGASSRFSNSPTGSGTVWNVYTSPYRAGFQLSSPYLGSPLMPVAAAPSGFGPAQDIFCVDFLHSANTNTTVGYDANFTNLGTNAADVDTKTRSDVGLTKYLQAAWLSSRIAGAAADSVGDINGAIWQIISGSPLYRRNTSGTWTDAGINSWMAQSVAGANLVNRSEWVVVTDLTAAGKSAVSGTSGGSQEYLTHVTPEPATLLLLGTGLLATLMAAGALRRSAV